MIGLTMKKSSVHEHNIEYLEITDMPNSYDTVIVLLYHSDILSDIKNYNIYTYI